MANTALNRTGVALLTNKSGGALSYGDVVVIDTTTDSSFTTTTTGGISTTQIGVIVEPAGIANNASGSVAFGVWVPRLNLNTAATRGQFIKSHTVAGQGTPHSSPQVEGDFAIALEASANPKAILFGSPNGPLSGGSGTVTHTAGALTASAVMVGNGTDDAKVLASLGTTTTVLHGNAAGLPTFGAVDLSADVSGVLGGSRGGGLVLLESHSASGSSTIDFTTRNATGQSGASFQSDYDQYRFEGIDIIAATNATSLQMRVGTGGGPTYDTGANYSWQRVYLQPGTASTGAAGTGGDTSITVFILVSNTKNLDFTIDLKSPQNSAYSKLFRMNGAQNASDGNVYINGNGSGFYTPTTALTAIRFLMASGNITSGTFRLYGVAK